MTPSTTARMTAATAVLPECAPPEPGESPLVHLAAVIVDDDAALAAVRDSRLAAKQVSSDDCAPDCFAEFDLRFVFLKLAAAHQQAAAFSAESGHTLLFPVPLHEGAVTE